MIEKIQSQLSLALSRVLEQYKGLPNIQGIIEVYAEQVQELEDVLFDMFTNRTLADATGQQLDEIGEIVGITRTSLDDDIYRIFILFKIGSNRSRATMESIISLFLLISGSEKVFVQNEGGGSISITYSTANTPDFETFLAANMPRVIAGGVKISGFIVEDGDAAFAFAGDIAGGLGFGDLNDPTAGGQFASVV